MPKLCRAGRVYRCRCSLRHGPKAPPGVGLRLRCCRRTPTARAPPGEVGARSGGTRMRVTHTPDRGVSPRFRPVAHTEKDPVCAARADDAGCSAHASCGARECHRRAISESTTVEGQGRQSGGLCGEGGRSCLRRSASPCESPGPSVPARAVIAARNSAEGMVVGAPVKARTMDRAGRPARSCGPSDGTSSRSWAWSRRRKVNPGAQDTRGPKPAWRVPTPSARRPGGETNAAQPLHSTEPPCTDPYAWWCGRGGAVRLPLSRLASITDRRSGGASPALGPFAVKDERSAGALPPNP